MCGIVGYVGEENASEILIEGLKKLEYRGYDSSGIAVNENGKIAVRKSKGRIKDLEDYMKMAGVPKGTCGIGHTRWATHGEPSDINSHPHSYGKVTLVHNGIIENYTELKENLLKKGYIFKSQTDTEVLAAFLDSIYQNNPINAINELVLTARGSYALGIIFEDKADIIYAVRKDSPLIIGLSENENFIASDVHAIISKTRKYYLLEENEVAVLNKNEVKILDLSGKIIKKEVQKVNFSEQAAEKGGFEHFMLKEIYEEPKALSDTIFPHIKDDLPNLSIPNFSDDKILSFKKIHIVACGTAMHAGLVGKTLIESLARIPVEVNIASEFRYSNPILSKDDLVIVISQSGETADTLAALKLAKKSGVFTLAVVNIKGSSIEREADATFLTNAGPEISVASTKAYAVQCAFMYLLSLKLALIYETKTKSETKELTQILKETPQKVSETIEYLNPICKALAKDNIKTDTLFFIGRGMDYALSVEGSLKLKEISYIHSEGYAAGELKHGTISLITEGTPVVAIATQTNLIEKMISNVKEIKARGGKVIFVTTENEIPRDAYDFLVPLVKTEDFFTPLILGPFIQLFAYYTALFRGCDVDKPRNLAKSVTVE